MSKCNCGIADCIICAQIKDNIYVGPYNGDFCQVTKVAGDGGQLGCSYLKSHSGPHSFELVPENNPEIKSDPVNPAHYQGDAVMVFIEQFDLGFCEGNAVKYIARHKTKGTPLVDLKKAMWYLERAISNLETELK